jgi:hypothetical protein
MANNEHPAVLKQGVEAWNAWRRNHADIRPDLSRIDLNHINLRKAERGEPAQVAGGHRDGCHVGIAAQPAGVSAAGSGASSSTPAANQRHAVEPGARGALRAGLLSIAGS